jgi:hypothetical protein
MVDLEANQTYTLALNNAPDPTNVSFTGTMYGFKPHDYIIIRLELLLKPDRVFIMDGAESPTPLTSDNNNGDWHWDNTTNPSKPFFSFILNYKEVHNLYKDWDFAFNVFKCRYANCTQPVSLSLSRMPPNSRPSQFRLWSSNQTWASVFINGEIKNRTPVFNESVVIPQNTWVVVDIPLPELLTIEIQGVLEFDDTLDNKLAAQVIFINGGYLIAGWKNSSFNHTLEISLTDFYN